MRTLFSGIVVSLVLVGPAWSEEVLFCTETASTGFIWEKGSAEGRQTGYRPSRYIVKILSETERTITKPTGDLPGDTWSYACHSPRPHLVRRISL